MMMFPVDTLLAIVQAVALIVIVVGAFMLAFKQS